MKPAVIALGACMLFCTPGVPWVLAGDDPAALKTLQGEHLSRIPGGVWILPEEQRLRERQSNVSRLRIQLLQQEKDIVARIERNRTLFGQLRAAEETLKKGALDNATRDQLRASIAALKTQCIDPRVLGGVPDVHDLVVAYAGARNELMMLVHAQREAISGLETAYRPLKTKPEVVEALPRLGKSQRLGPATNYDSELKELRDADSLLRSADGWLGSAAPLYWEGNRQRVPAVLNALQPLTFTWKESSEATLLTTSMVEAAGITVPADAPTSIITLPGRRELTVRRVALGTLDFGRMQLHDVEAYVLPPEGEDWGAQIGPAAFGKMRTTAEPEWLRLVMRVE